MGKKINWAEKDKDLLQMMIRGVQCNSCSICKEVSHPTRFCSLNINQFASPPKYFNATASIGGAESPKAMQRKAICHFFNGQA